MSQDDRDNQLKEIRDEVLGLIHSPLYEYRASNGYFPVIGQGSHYAKIMFIGEAPGRNEAQTGRPFCGAAGRILDELLASIGIPRQDVYITNIVKDRPPQNRDPLPDEIAVYGPFLDRQIDIIQPEVIATLGRYSMGYIMEKLGLEAMLRPISALHGSVISVNRIQGYPKTVVPLYHPAAAIYDQRLKQTLLEDFKALLPFVSKEKTQ